MSAIISTLLTVLLQIAGQSLTSANAQAIISALTQALPTIIKEFADLVPIVQNIINVIQNSGADLTQAQWDALAALNKQCDDAFEAEADLFDDEGNPKPPAS